MSETPSKRVSLSLDESAAAALEAAAALRGLRPTSLAASFVIAALSGDSPPPAHEAAPAPARHEPEPAAGRADWLELDRGQSWRRAAWDAVEGLRRDYPDLGDLVKAGWTEDRFTRDGVVALAVWRFQLDRGGRADPRLEHQWLTALRDLKHMLNDRAGHVGAPVRALDRPTDWT